MYEHRYLGPKGHQLSASCNAPNLIAPGDELGFRVDWKLPYFRHKKDPKKSTLSASAFNARKISGVFIAGASSSPHPSSSPLLPPVAWSRTLQNFQLFQGS